VDVDKRAVLEDLKRQEKSREEERGEAVAGSKKAEVELPTDERILITREFDAPRHVAYRAWTEPELIERWWGGERGEVTSVEIDLRVGACGGA
jgi:hypothetical protein